MAAVQALRVPEGYTLGFEVIRNPGESKLAEIVAARNAITDRVLQSRARYVFFLDDDVIPPPNTLVELTNVLVQHPQARVAGGLYKRRGFKNASYLVWKGNYEEYTDEYITTWEPNSVFQASGLGGGCMLIDTSVFAELSQPWFHCDFVRQPTRSNPDGYVINRVTDDAYFCLKVVKAGFEVLAHAGVLCEHESAIPTDDGYLVSQF